MTTQEINKAILENKIQEAVKKELKDNNRFWLVLFILQWIVVVGVVVVSK